MEYLMHIGVMLSIYCILVLSTNLTVGMANLLTLCQAAFYGIGAYIGAFFLMQFHLPFTVIALVVMLATGLTSLVVSFASVKLKGDYFILATLGLQMIVLTILSYWTSVTRGALGIPAIPPIRLFGVWSLDSIRAYFFFTLALAALCLLFFHRLQRSPFGRMLRSIRTDEISAQALGRNTVSLKAWAFFLSAAFAGMAGLVYASYAGYLHPTGFTLNESIFILTALFIGGIGRRVWGPVAGAAVVVILPEALRYVGLPNAVAANLRLIVFGLILILLMFYRPQGLLGDSELK